jgi:hypothetical protein
MEPLDLGLALLGEGVGDCERGLEAGGGLSAPMTCGCDPLVDAACKFLKGPTPCPLL